MRIFLPLSLLALLAGCITAQTKADLAAATANVAKLQTQVDQATASNAANLADLKAQLAAAQLTLQTVQAQATTEKQQSVDMWTAAGQGAVTSAAGPVGALFPAGLPILGLLGGVLGLIQGNYGTKKVA